VNAAVDIKIERAMPWALIAAACLASFAASCSGTTRAPLLLAISHDLDVSVPVVANLVSLTSISWGITSALGGWLSDRLGRRALLLVAPLVLAVTMALQAQAATFVSLAAWAWSAAARVAPSWAYCSPRCRPMSSTGSAAGHWAG